MSSSPRANARAAAVAANPRTKTPPHQLNPPRNGHRNRAESAVIVPRLRKANRMNRKLSLRTPEQAVRTAIPVRTHLRVRASPGATTVATATGMTIRSSAWAITFRPSCCSRSARQNPSRKSLTHATECRTNMTGAQESEALPSTPIVTTSSIVLPTNTTYSHQALLQLGKCKASEYFSGPILSAIHIPPHQSTQQLSEIYLWRSFRASFNVALNLAQLL